MIHAHLCTIHSDVMLPAISYFDVETRLVPVKASNGFIMDPHDAIQFVDENTIGIIVILGSTYTGHFENVLLMSHLCAHKLPVASWPYRTNYIYHQ